MSEKSIENPKAQETLESLIAQIQELMIEIKNEQTNLAKNAEEHHKVTMQKLDRLRTFNEIVDMTNCIFERRLGHIEHSLETICKTNGKMPQS